MSKDSPFADESLSIDPKEYLGHVRSLPCVVNRKDCFRAVDPHHLFNVGLGRNRKVARWEDFTVIPLCRRCHSEQHSIGWLSFQSQYAVDFYFEGLKILAKWIFHKSKLQEEENGQRDKRDQKNEVS